MTWGNVLIRHVREWKHQKYSPWTCLFSGVEFHGAFHFQKIIFLQLLQIWSSYYFHCDTDQLWTHTKQQQDKMFQTDFIDSQISDPPFAHLLALSHICLYHCLSACLIICQCHYVSVCPFSVFLSVSLPYFVTKLESVWTLTFTSFRVCIVTVSYTHLTLPTTTYV